MFEDRIDTVEIRQEPEDRKPTLASLMQLYLHDFSEFAAIYTEHGELGPDGRFAYAKLDRYWTDASRTPLTIWADGRLAGFVLLNQWSALEHPLDWAVAEFFIVRKYRRHRVGSRAADLVFARFPGRWEVPVAGYNAPALAFWRHAICAAVGRPATEITGDGERWSGPVLCFETEAVSRG